MSTTTHRISWDDICEQHPDEWVCLVDVERTSDGAIKAARVVGHGKSITHTLEQLGS